MYKESVLPSPTLFWSKVDKNGPVPEHNKSLGNCWIWTAGTTTTGYGKIGTRRNGVNKTMMAHLVSMQFNNTPIPEGMLACHHCDTPLCVNPNHIFPGTHQDNSDDKVSKQRHVFGETHPTAKLSDKDVEEIRRKYAIGGCTHQALADDYGVCRQHVTDLINGKRRS